MLFQSELSRIIEESRAQSSRLGKFQVLFFFLVQKKSAHVVVVDVDIKIFISNNLNNDDELREIARAHDNLKKKEKSKKIFHSRMKLFLEDFSATLSLSLSYLYTCSAVML